MMADEDAADYIYGILYETVPDYIFLFPLVSGLAWFTTLTILLLYWVSLGRPTFPGQSNPYVAFVSDIAAYHLKIPFIIGCTITSITFIGTVFSVHHARHSARFFGFPGVQGSWRFFISIITLVAGIVAGVCLFLLAIFDTVREHERHRLLLMSTFFGLGITAIGMGLVLGEVWIGIKRPEVRRERVGGTKQTKRLRFWCSVNFVLTLAIAVLGVAFTALLNLHWMRTAGIIEWVVAYVGSLWLLSFVGFLTQKSEVEFPVDDADSENGDDSRPLYQNDDDETEPLIVDGRRSLV